MLLGLVWAGQQGTTPVHLWLGHTEPWIVSSPGYAAGESAGTCSIGLMGASLSVRLHSTWIPSLPPPPPSPARSTHTLLHATAGLGLFINTGATAPDLARPDLSHFLVTVTISG